MAARPPSLLDLQRTIARALGPGGDGDIAALVLADGLAPEARLGIYRNTATSTLVTALRLCFPAVHALVGADCFEGAARLYMEASPPQSAWLDAYGATFPAFLARLPQLAALGYLPDMAQLEWEVNASLHAPDAAPLDLERLGALTEAEQANVRLIPTPAARLLRSAFPVDAIWRAVLSRDDDAMAGIDLATGSTVRLLVLRTSDGIDIARMNAWQWDFTTALFAGQPLYIALEPAPSAEVQGWLATLLASGCFSDFSLAGRLPDICLRDPSP